MDTSLMVPVADGAGRRRSSKLEWMRRLGARLVELADVLAGELRAREHTEVGR